MGFRVWELWKKGETCERVCEKGGGEWQDERERGMLYFFLSVLEGKDFDVQQLWSTVGETPRFTFIFLLPWASAVCLTRKYCRSSCRRRENWISTAAVCRQAGTGAAGGERRSKAKQRHAARLQRRNSETAVQQTSCLWEVNPQGQKKRERVREKTKTATRCTTQKLTNSLGQGTSGTATTEWRKQGR